jgi:predicted HicB family RNase H-like nuclease
LEEFVIERPEPKTQLTVRLPTPMTNRLQAEAKSQGVSVGQVIWARLLRTFGAEDREAKR